MMKRQSIYLLICILSLVAGESLSAAPTSSKVLKAGAVLYLTQSDYANVAKEFKRGLELAVSDSDIDIELIIEDDEGQNSKAVTATQKLIAVDKVDLLLFSEYVQVQAAGPLAQRAKIPTLVYWESSPEIQNVGDHIFGIGLWTPSAGGAPARFAIQELGAKTASLIYDVSSWSDNVSKYFKREFTRLGGKIVLEETLPKGASDFRTSIARMKQKKSDVLFAPASEHPAAFFKQLKVIGYEKPVLSSDQISQEFIDAANGSLEGVYFSNADEEFGTGSESLIKKYKRVYDEAPGSLYFVALAYDALCFAVKAWKEKEDRSYKAALRNLKDFKGVLGPIVINQNNSFPREEVIYLVRDGKAEPRNNI